MKHKWQPDLLHLKNPNQILSKIINRLECIYGRASFIQLHSRNENSQLGALKCMLASMQRLYETLVLPEILSRRDRLEGVAKGTLTRDDMIQITATDEEHEILDKATRIIAEGRKERIH